MKNIPVHKIGFDFDGVIADTGETFVRLACKEYGFCSFALEDIVTFEVEQCLHMPKEIIEEIFNNIMHDSIGTGLKPLFKAVEVIEDMAKIGPVNVVTARTVEQPLLDWFNIHFSTQSCENINIVTTGAPDNKAEHIHGLELEFFVDDRADTCLHLNTQEITPFVYNQPWNEGQHNLKTVNNWQEIRDLLIWEEIE